MITKKAVEITDIDWSKYGILYDLSGSSKNAPNTNFSEGADFVDVDTSIPIIDTLGRLGRTQTKKVPFTAVEMEKHGHTQEAQLPAGQPIVFCVAAGGESAPQAEDVIPVILRPGYAFVLHRNIWHSPSHGLECDGAYYWMADVYDGEPTVWADISGGPVLVE